jgi:hypothetical protein
MRLDAIYMRKRYLLLFVLAFPVVTWAFLKPVRVLAPELAGVSCISDVICLDDTSKYAEASALYAESLLFASEIVGKPKQNPKVIFCATETCYRSFSLFGRSVANTIATIGIVLSPRAWQPHFLRHEMIHHIQKERLGNLRAWLVTPEWFSEGMAYSLSQDPRANIGEPWQHYRSQFEPWYQQVGKEHLWEEAAKL